MTPLLPSLQASTPAPTQTQATALSRHKEGGTPISDVPSITHHKDFQQTLEQTEGRGLSATVADDSQGEPGPLATTTLGEGLEHPSQAGGALSVLQGQLSKDINLSTLEGGMEQAGLLGGVEVEDISQTITASITEELEPTVILETQWHPLGWQSSVINHKSSTATAANTASITAAWSPHGETVSISVLSDAKALERSLTPQGQTTMIAPVLNTGAEPTLSPATTFNNGEDLFKSNLTNMLHYEASANRGHLMAKQTDLNFALSPQALLNSAIKSLGQGDVARVPLSKLSKSFTSANGASPLAGLGSVATIVPQKLPEGLQIPVNISFGQPQWSVAIAERTAWLAGQKIHSAELQLDPPELGPLQVRITVNNEQASVTFVSHSAAVRDSLDQSLVRLRDLLEQQGLNLSDANVSDQELAGREEDGTQAENNAPQPGNPETIDAEAKDNTSTTMLAVSERLVDSYV